MGLATTTNDYSHLDCLPDLKTRSVYIATSCQLRNVSMTILSRYSFRRDIFFVRMNLSTMVEDSKVMPQIRLLNNIYYIQLPSLQLPILPAKNPSNILSQGNSGTALIQILHPRFAENFTIVLEALETQQIGSINKSADQQCPFKSV
ncbi:hypothetical protein CEXT_10721 [Caerostris extrusa]|uniref:Uncharacterized protein n=1 Tax=Caerostris extrusa TaxID=172846 RepID=A0AAV4VMC5_CAEEX|nr:hypothetical protein CEXT_10721 [Caerostris extrusa]